MLRIGGRRRSPSWNTYTKSLKGGAMKTADLSRFWKIYRATRRAMFNRAFRQAQAALAACKATYCLKEGN